MQPSNDYGHSPWATRGAILLGLLLVAAVSLSVIENKPQPDGKPLALGAITPTTFKYSGGINQRLDRIETKQDAHNAGTPAATTTTSGATTTAVTTTTAAPTTTSGATTTTATTTTVPGSPTKPTAANTGPRIALTDMSGGCISGSYSGKRITGGGATYPCSAPLSFTDCEMNDMTLLVYSSTLTLDHCDLNNVYIGILAENTNPAVSTFTMKFSYHTGQIDNDAIHIGGNVWGNPTYYVNALVEDSVLYSPYSSLDPLDHFDLLQMGGGQNATFNRVVFSFLPQTFRGTLTNYYNNGALTGNVVMNNVWFEGGPVGYTIGGPVTINGCIIDDSTWAYGPVYPDGDPAQADPVLNNCFDQSGNPVT